MVVDDMDIAGLVSKLNKLTQVTSTATNTVSDAKQLLGIANLEALGTLDIGSLSPTVFNKMVDSKCYEEKILVEKCDAYVSDIRTSIKGIITIISLYKEEANLNLRPPTNVFKTKRD